MGRAKHLGSIWNTLLGGEPCREYEKRWRDLCVDKDLEDSWLERLNSISFGERVFIYETCAGHINPSSWQNDRPRLIFWPQVFSAALHSPSGYEFYGVYSGELPTAPMNKKEEKLDEFMRQVFEGLADVREARVVSGHRIYDIKALIPRSEMNEAEFVGWWEEVIGRLEWFARGKRERSRLAGCQKNRRLS